MSNRTRSMVSGRDLQVRYALWRMIDIADSDDNTLKNSKFRLEWEINDHNGKSIFADILIENKEGKIVEIIECKEHKELLPKDSVYSFLSCVERLQNAPMITDETCFRFVSTQSFIMIGKKVLNLVRNKNTDIILNASEIEDLPKERLKWEFSFHSKNMLTSTSILILLTRFGLNPKESIDIYIKYYAILTAHMSRRVPIDISDVNSNLGDIIYTENFENNYFEKFSKTSEKEYVDEATLCAELSRWKKMKIKVDDYLKTSIIDALRRPIFGEGNTQIQQIYVKQYGTLKCSEKKFENQILIDLLLFWLSQVIQNKIARVPLLLLGTFGTGKSCLLNWFALNLLDNKFGIQPVPVPLRDIRPTKRISIENAVKSYIKNKYYIDIDKNPTNDKVKYCLLCDGFDELNLFSLSGDTEDWVRECFFELRRIAERPDCCMVIASRDILFMDIKRRNFEGKDCPVLTLNLFTENQIEEWCSNYRNHSRIISEFNYSMLNKRGLFPAVQIPIVLYMTAKLVETYPDWFKANKQYSNAEIFRKYIDWTCATGGYHKDDKKHDVPDDYRDILKYIAYLFFKSGKTILEEKHIISSLQLKFGGKRENIPIDRNILVAHMLRESFINETDQDQAIQNYIEFTHLSFQEYLVAELVWDIIEPCIKGNRLDILRWFEIANHPLSAVEFAFLKDMINVLKPLDLVNLIDGLRNFAAIHLYSSTKATSSIYRCIIDQMNNAKEFDSIRKLDITSYHILCLTVLAFLLCKISIQLLRTNKEEAITFIESLDFDSGKYLSQILNYCKSISGQWHGKNERPVANLPDRLISLLLSNLDGIEIKSNTTLLGCSFEGLNCCNSIFRNVYFMGSEFHNVLMDNCDFSGSNFQRCFIWIKTAKNTIFTKCNFADAIIAQEDEPLIGGDFTHADFSRTQFLNTSIKSATFSRNTWTGAFFYSNSGITPTITDCYLDDAAYSFFKKNGVHIQGCQSIA